MLKFNKKGGANSIHTTDSTKLLTAASTFAVKEAYNSIRTNLLFTQQGEKCPIFVVTSPTANNGKTINSANLAINFAQMGKKTLVIDADMRNPSLHKLFSLSSRNGLSEILAGLTDNITVTKTDIENLSVLTSGKIPPNPTELLSSPRMDKLLDFVKEHYDCVFIDTPPVNIVTDATVFSQKATGYVIIVKTDTTNVPELKTTVSTLQGINANILGFILNDANSEKKKYYSYYRKYSRNYSYNYKYSYGNDKK
ncbi:MAG: CpsD/CapB family tyrosine-protein kinase [Eubacterium coprostanoligenes]|uniref:CpsD/CapB family tyrosine-protein kinase n=1 Tax=Eubacterium coprostanoligenes TaxID=290054 RepID=UPI0023F38294|nr:CpsD/CapB family tyrosine-protein kinase [Eubacterium coprostanoligenes]MCI6361562.1 CpsD/CapB family tyrosine-protein kinase [Eubacterium coprostanoligenes]MDD6665680.1 CpsD/CapB family tyrosine-protein kinase [Eubacterium coprostanoligenes]MDD7358263.1 CpsD/CapB family tyrosine-protein kinase [Eubacterium coprostanoligenes]MDY4699405.1 CpsD/CapB family tyrosine-protein kinase [Eubacterium coprostanoligenes]